MASCCGGSWSEGGAGSGRTRLSVEQAASDILDSRLALIGRIVWAVVLGARCLRAGRAAPW
jgi:hypothetical protein